MRADDNSVPAWPAPLTPSSPGAAADNLRHPALMRPALIDTDPGVDDALALLLAWGTPALAVRWITTVAGNVAVEACTRNVFRLLDLRRPSVRPRVAAGATQPLARPLVTAVKYHGADGLGELSDWPRLPDAAPEAVDAASMMLEAVQETSGALTLIAIGPLTNVAIAIERDAAALARVQRVVVMGGAVDVPGNITPDAEFNMHVDPEAAARVLAAGLPLDLVPLDATRQATLGREAFEGGLARLPSAYAERILRFTAAAFRRDATTGMVLHDPLAVSVAIDETLVTWEPVCLRVGRDGETRRAAGPANCRIAKRVDTARFIPSFLDAVCRVS